MATFTETLAKIHAHASKELAAKKAASRAEQARRKSTVRQRKPGHSAKDVENGAVVTFPGRMVLASKELTARVSRAFIVDSPVLDNAMMCMVFFIDDHGRNVCATYDDIFDYECGLKSVSEKINESRALKTGLNAFAMIGLIAIVVAMMVF